MLQVFITAMCLDSSCAVVFGCDVTMACFTPLIAYHGKVVNPATGKRSLVFDVRRSYDGLRLRVPCGGCVGCRLSHASQWAVRCTHEKRMHQASAFVTLTYDNEHLPPGSSLVLRDLQLFMKRLRKVRPAGLRFFGCGEYGETTLRPHYHLLLLNTDFPDERYYKRSATGHDLFTSAELSSLWSAGNHLVGSVTPESISYVCKYVLKKARGRGSDLHYAGRVREFVVMSRRPGIGLSWFEKYHGEAYAHDNAIINARSVPLPRYYDDKFDQIDSDRLAELKLFRQRRADEHWQDNTRDRLFVRERLGNLLAKRFARDPL